MSCITFLSMPFLTGNTFRFPIFSFLLLLPNESDECLALLTSLVAATCISLCGNPYRREQERKSLRRSIPAFRHHILCEIVRLAFFVMIQYPISPSPSQKP